jgi:hypothetical protein
MLRHGAHGRQKRFVKTPAADQVKSFMVKSFAAVPANVLLP